LSLPHQFVTATWHDNSLTHAKILFFKKNSKKKLKIKKLKIEELTHGTPSNDVNPNLTKRVNLRHFNKKRDQFETFKNSGTKLRF